jgi:hypothetical protein
MFIELTNLSQQKILINISQIKSIEPCRSQGLPISKVFGVSHDYIFVQEPYEYLLDKISQITKMI